MAVSEILQDVALACLSVFMLSATVMLAVIAKATIDDLKK